MAKCSPGDSVICRVKNNTIVSVYEDKWQEDFVFDIVSLHDEGYMIYIPIDMSIKDSVQITSGNHKKYKLDKKFIGSTLCYITEYKIASIHRKLDGMCCSKCSNFYGMAAPNQPDGTLICWSCKHYPSYR